MRKVAILILVLGWSLSVQGAPTKAEPARNGHGHAAQSGANVFNLTVPAHPYDLILARPEKNSVTLSVLAYEPLDCGVAYGTQPGHCTNLLPGRVLPAGVPAEWRMGLLQPDTAYVYQVRTRPPGALPFADSAEYAFHTARPTGASFTFTLTADVHLDEHTSAEVYQQSLANIRADQPDFHVDLGNLFMTDKHAMRAEAARQYLAQRFYLGQIGASVPLLLALGVHDGESSRYDDGSPGNLADWSNQLRQRYFPNPSPDDFYSGNATFGNYYAWQWGDALFVVLDPYRYSLRQRGGNDGWSWSLGREQYDWLARTLAGSPARYKFVFLHNLLAGDQASRGGVEIARFNEWGGKNLDGSEGFAAHRPGWPMPVQSLLVQQRVTAVFKAHDNFYARQELDGIVYLMVPQPSFAGNDRIRDLQNYGYQQGVFLGNSGHVRVRVAPEQVTLEYCKAVPAASVADHFVMTAK